MTKLFFKYGKMIHRKQVTDISNVVVWKNTKKTYGKMFYNVMYYDISNVVVWKSTGNGKCFLTSCTRKTTGFPWKIARMRIQKLRNIRPSGVFSPDVRSSNVTWPQIGFPCKGWSALMRNRKLRNTRSNVTRRASPGSHVIKSSQ